MHRQLVELVFLMPVGSGKIHLESGLKFATHHQPCYSYLGRYATTMQTMISDEEMPREMHPLISFHYDRFLNQMMAY